MPSFSAPSLANIVTLHPGLRAILHEAIRLFDFSVVHGRRGKLAQDEAFRLGFSRVRWPDSKHNCPIPASNIPRANWPEDPNGVSLAVDIAPYPVNWRDEKQFAYLAGRIVEIARHLDIPVRWLGDPDGDGRGAWNDPNERGALSDLGHFEIIEADLKSTSDLPSPRMAVAPTRRAG